MTIQRRLRVTLLTALCLAMCLCTTAFADTDGTEPKITQQPDQLVFSWARAGQAWSLSCAPTPVSSRPPS